MRRRNMVRIQGEATPCGDGRARRARASALGLLALLALGCDSDHGGAPPPLVLDPSGLGDPGACAAMCGDAVCDPEWEDCGQCAVDCVAECVGEGPGFLPIHTAIALGEAFEDRCGGGVLSAAPLGLAAGAEAMPFEVPAAPLTTPAGCGGVEDGEPTVGEGLSLLDGSFGSTLTCLNLLPNGKAPPLQVGLRYEVGRWRELGPGAYERPGTLGLGGFWFASYSRRLHGDVPPWQPEAWDEASLPDELTLVLEDYRSHRFVRQGDSRIYRQPGAESETASVAFLELVEGLDPAACIASGDPSRFIANNDAVLHYPDGTRDVFSGRDLTFKGHIDEDLGHLVVTHGTITAEGEAACDAGPDRIGIKRIASYAAFASEPLVWVDLEHEYRELPRPGHEGERVGVWQLRRIVDSEGRVISIEQDPEALGRITAVTMFEGAPDERRIELGYDDAQVVRSLSLPTPNGDTANVVTMTHEHPSAEGGASRVLEQQREIGGQLQSTTMSWRSGEVDLEVGLPGGHFRRFGHEVSQATTHQTLWHEDRDRNRLVASYAMDATANPQRVRYDERTGLVAEECDELSPGPSGSAEVPGSRCVGSVYDEDHDLVRRTSWAEDGELAVTTLEYEVFAPGNDHRIRRTTGPMGDQTHYAYESYAWLGGRIESPRLAEVTDALGNTTTMTYCEGTSTCPFGKLHEIVDPVGGVSTMVYDPVLGTVMLARDGDLTQERTAYDARGCLLSTNGRSGIEHAMVFAPGQGDCLPVQLIENPDGEGSDRRVTSFEYDQARNVVRTIRDAEGTHSNSGAIEESEYQVIDAQGTQAAVRSVQGLGGDTVTNEVRVEHSPLGDVVRVREVDMDRATEIDYQRAPDGSLTIVTRRTGIEGERIEQLDPAGRLIRSSDERGVGSVYEYDDDSGREIAVATGAGEEVVITRYEYALDGQITRMFEPDDVVTSYFYDEARRNVGQQRGDMIELVELDPAGRPITRKQIQGSGEEVVVHMEYANDGHGSRLRSTTLVPADGSEPLTITNHYETEAMPWGACEANDPGNCYETSNTEMPREHGGEHLSRTTRYDGLGRLVEATTLGGEQGGTTYHYAYDGLDCLREITGGGGAGQSFECDRRGRRVQETAWTTRTWDYYPDGTLHVFEDFDGTRTTNELDASGWRLGRIRYSNEPQAVVHTDDIELSYLPNDLLATMVDGSGTTTYEYDGLNRVRARTHTPPEGEPLTLAYEYAPGSLRLEQLDYWGQGTVGYQYDAQGRIATVDAFGQVTKSYKYEDDGRLRSSNTGLTATKYHYDPLQRIAAIEHTQGAIPGWGVNLLTLDYSGQSDESLPGLDEHGNVGSIVETWLDEAPLVNTFSYDDDDRLRGYWQDTLWPDKWSDGTNDADLDRLSGELVYDERGNATRFIDDRELAYDAHDRIVTDGFAYDANGNLVCVDDDGECHCFNGVQDADETGIDCGGDQCSCCLEGGGSVQVPPFVGSMCPQLGTAVDFDALRAEAESYHAPWDLSLAVEIPYDTPGCGNISIELPVPCGEASYQDYRLWRMGGAIQPMIVPFTSPNWVHNPSYYAEGMMDPFYTHPAKEFLVDCNNLGTEGNMCAVGNYGDGLSNSGLEPCNLARQDLNQGPMQPGPEAYDGNIRAFPVYQRATPALGLPEGYQECYDIIEFNAQGGPFPVCQSPTAGYHGSIFVLLQGVGSCQS